MDAESLGLAILELCINYVQQLETACQAYKNADREVRESILRIIDTCAKTKSRIEALTLLWSSLVVTVQVHHSLVLSLLDEKLQLAVIVVNGLNSSADRESPRTPLRDGTQGDLRRFRYAMAEKKKIERIAVDLEQWHRSFDPSWYLLVSDNAWKKGRQRMIRQAGANLEVSPLQELHNAHLENKEPAALSSSVFLPNRAFVQDRKDIANTALEIGRTPAGVVIVDPLRIVAGNDAQVVTKYARDLARTLRKVESATTGLLACQGAVKLRDSFGLKGFELVFKLPLGFSRPQGLRTFLLAGNQRYSLDGRFQLARSLARSVSFLRSARIAHKNISPESILLFEDARSSLNVPFLVGFQGFRREETQTLMNPDKEWNRNLYRYPSRQGEHLGESDLMQYDIYSLGVCLLEIGLGLSFVDFDAETISDGNLKGICPNPELRIAEYLAEKDAMSGSLSIKGRLIEMAETQLPGKMGLVYRDIVVSCLTCLDSENRDFSGTSNSAGEEGSVTGVRYIEKILYKFDEIRF